MISEWSWQVEAREARYEASDAEWEAMCEAQGEPEYPEPDPDESGCYIEAPSPTEPPADENEPESEMFV